MYTCCSIQAYRVRIATSHTRCPSKRVVYVLQEPLKEELDRLQKQQIIMLLGVDEMLEWCSSSILVPKVNGKVQLCLNLARLNKALIRPVHRGPTLNHILLWLAGVRYLTLIDASSGCHDLKLDKRLSYLTMFSCPYGRYRSTRL